MYCELPAWAIATFGAAFVVLSVIAAVAFLVCAIGFASDGKRQYSAVCAALFVPALLVATFAVNVIGPYVTEAANALSEQAKVAVTDPPAPSPYPVVVAPAPEPSEHEWSLIIGDKVRVGDGHYVVEKSLDGTAYLSWTHGVISVTPSPAPVTPKPPAPTDELFKEI